LRSWALVARLYHAGMNETEPTEERVEISEAETKCGCGRALHHVGRCWVRRGLTEAPESVAKLRSGGNVDLTATHPGQLPHLQNQLLAWARQKVEVVRAERDESTETLEAAKQAGFRLEQLERAAKREQKRYEFYQKLLAALEAGYVLMPTLAADVFAVRTKRRRPDYQLVRYGNAADLNDIDAQTLPAGEGRFVSNRPIDRIRSERANPVERERYGGDSLLEAKALNETVDFPLQVAKPEIINVTSKAIEERIFDEIGISPTRHERWNTMPLPDATAGDPIVTGRIIAPNKRRISFLIAWHVPTIDL
jgi:hypothetical protein